ncbi:MAG: hypothetical protein GY847_09915 [Proteobacteria bacterium]|nr:hypothetical protein [Pseudomonadota bacterium]
MMKRLFCLMGLVFVAGCGSASSSGSPVEKGTKTVKPTETETKEAPIPIDEEEESEPVKVTGEWENSSCGERKYRRSITFLEDGKFEAVDEVAPCPPDVQCIKSGIINWHGTWSLEDRSIALDIQPFEGRKMPEILPSGFVILRQDPVSVGGREGDIICPYQKSK